MNSLRKFIWRDYEEKKSPTNLGEELRQVMNSAEVENSFQAAAPFLALTLMSWPTYWLARGLMWSRVRGTGLPLSVFVKETYHQAKVLQIGMLATGVFMSMLQDPHHTLFTPSETDD